MSTPAYHRAYYLAHKEKFKEARQKYRHANPTSNWNSQLKYKFGITLAEFQKLEHRQNGLCLVCERAETNGHKLSVDHDHATGKVRGLLCNSCNVGLGQFEDRPDLLVKAAEYLRKS